MASINTLSPVLLSKILSKTDLLDWIKTLPTVCRNWKNAMRFVWETVDGFKYKFRGFIIRDEIEEDFVIFINNRQLVHYLILHGLNREITNAGFKYITDRLSSEAMKLFSLDLWHSYKIKNFPKKFGDLKFISRKVGDKFRKLQSLELIFSDVGFHVVENIVHIFHGLEDLEKISITYDFNEENVLHQQQMVLLLTNAFSSCKKLRVVEIRSNNINTPDIFQNLDYLPILEEFSFIQSSQEGITVAFLEQIFVKLSICAKTLKSLRLYFSLQIGTVFDARRCGKIMSEFGAKKSITKFELHIDVQDTRYTSLITQKMNQISQFTFWAGLDEIYSKLVYFKDLKEVTLIGINLLQTSIVTTFQGLSCQLKKLHLLKTHNLDDSFFENITNGMSELEFLQITFHYDEYGCVTEVGLIEFLEKCPKLNRLKLQDLHTNSFSISKCLTLLHNRLHRRAQVTSDNKESKLLTVIIEDRLLKHEIFKEDIDLIQELKSKQCCMKIIEKVNLYGAVDYRAMCCF